MKYEHRCQCPLKGEANMPSSMYSRFERNFRVHLPGQCQNPQTQHVIRKRKRIWICSVCILPNDKLMYSKEK